MTRPYPQNDCNIKTGGLLVKMCKKAMSMVLALAMVVKLNGASVGAKAQMEKAG